MGQNKSFAEKDKKNKKSGIGKRSFIKEIKYNLFSYILAIPAVVYTLFFGYLTLPYMVIAFQKFDYSKNIWNSEWVGTKNFAFFFRSPRAWQVTSNTLKLNVLFMLVGIVVALLFSLMFNEIRKKHFLKVTQSMFLFPNFLSWVVISYILYSFLSSNNGIINNLLVSMGMQKINWYSEPDYWPGILVMLKTWKETGMSTIIYLAAISGFDPRLYEAAHIDGASRFQNAFHITLPMLLPTVCILALLGLGKMFSADFGMIYSLIRDNGVLYKTTDVIDTYTFRALRKTGDPSQAMAVGLYQSVMGFILVFTTNWLTRKYFREGALF